MFDKKTTAIIISIMAFAFMYSTFVSEAEFVTGQQGRSIRTNVGSGSGGFAGGGNDTNYTVCMGSACVVVSGNGTDQCQTDVDCNATNQTHNICLNLACVTVSGPGMNECNTNSDCRRYVDVESFKHTECFVNSWGWGYCAVVNGTGRNQCSLSNGWQDCNKLDCVYNVTSNGTCSYVFGIGPDECSSVGSYCGNATHNVCQNNACVTIEGIGTDQCISDADCGNVSLLPDLDITSFWVNVTYGNSTALNVTTTMVVSNIGTATASSSTLRLRFTETSASNWWYFDRDIYIGPLPPGLQYHREYSEYLPNNHNWTLNGTADYYDVVTELNEWNNGAYTTFST